MTTAPLPARRGSPLLWTVLGTILIAALPTRPASAQDPAQTPPQNGTAASDPTAVPAPAATAPGPLDGLLANIALPLQPEQRAEIARDAIARNRWNDLSRLLGAALLSDTTSGYVDQLPWISRLRLAQACTWLGAPEESFAARQIEIQKTFSGVSRQEMPQPSWLRAPDAAEKLAPVFGDAANFPRPGIVAQRIKPETLVALLSNQTLINDLGETATLDDYQPGVWRVLADLQEHRPEGMVDYPALAVALAVVYDRAFPPDWPHGQVARSQIPFVWENWNNLFDYFIDAQRDGTLLVDPATLTPGQLRFLVDIPLDPSELDWVRQNVHADRSSFDKVFFTVKYDRERIADWELYWIWKDYDLRRIRDAGGICVDQAYFAAMAGKALGIPTLFFTGIGTYGGHAWFGFLKEENTWFLDAGRYANQNYVTGTARDPQTWAEINDHQLAFLSNTGDSRVVYNYSRDMLALALLPGIRENAGQRQRLLAAALTADPKLPEIWEAVAATLREMGQIEALESHYQAMVAQFADQDDLRVEALHALAQLDEQEGRPDDAEALRQQILASRSDLAIAELGEILVRDLRAGNVDASQSHFEAFVANFFSSSSTGKSSAGDLFYNLISPYINMLKRVGAGDVAKKELTAVAPHFDLTDPNNLLTQDFNDLQSQLSKTKKNPDSP